MLLAGEDDFDLAEPRRTLDELPPRLLRARASDTGSIFHEGGVWPPPGARSQLADPLMAASSVDLHSIVEEVMGPSTTRLRGGEGSFGSESDSFYRDGPSGGSMHSAGGSISSQSGLLAGNHPYAYGYSPAPHHPSPLASSTTQDRNDGQHSPPSPPSAWLSRHPKAREASSSPPGNSGKRRSRMSVSTAEEMYPLSPRNPDEEEDEASRPESSVLPMRRSQNPHAHEETQPLVDTSTGDEMMHEIPPRYDMIRRDTGKSADIRQ